VAVAAVAVAEVAVAVAEVAEDKGTVDEGNYNEIKIKNHDFLENFSGRFCDPYFLLVRPRLARGATGQIGGGCRVAAKTTGIRHAETGRG
jgi:hypothetical protein